MKSTRFSLIPATSGVLEEALIHACEKAERTLPSFCSAHSLLRNSREAKQAAICCGLSTCAPQNNASGHNEGMLQNMRELHLKSAHEKAYLTALLVSLKSSIEQVTSAINQLLPTLPRDKSHIGDRQRATMVNVVVASQLLESMQLTKAEVIKIAEEYEEAVGNSWLTRVLLDQTFFDTVDKLEKSSSLARSA